MNDYTSWCVFELLIQVIDASQYSIELYQRLIHSFPFHQELVRLLQQTLRSSQCDWRSTVPPGNMGTQNQNQEETEVNKALAERDTHIKDLCGHIERLALEKESLQQELKGLKIKIGEINEQLGMLMETIQAKDEVIMKLSQQSDEGETQSAECNSPSATREQQELVTLKVLQEHCSVYFPINRSECVCEIINSLGCIWNWQQIKACSEVLDTVKCFILKPIQVSDPFWY